MTKEDFLKEAYNNYFGSPNWDNSVAKHNIEWIRPAIDEYAKQEAIAFAKFAMENSWQELNFGVTSRTWVSRDDYREYSDEEFYQLYLKSKSSPF